MSKELYNISTVVIADKTSKNLFELTSRNSPKDFVASEDLKRALENSPPHVQAIFQKLFGSYSNKKNMAGIHADLGSRRRYKMAKRISLLIDSFKVENCFRK